MRIEQLLENIQRPVDPNQVYYHGTDQQFSNFSLNVKRVQSDITVHGVYFSPREYIAKGFGRNVIAANLNVRNSFYNRSRNRITPKMISVFKSYLMQYTNAKEDWIDSALVPEFIENGNFRSLMNINGSVKRDILLAGGYDSYIDGDDVVILEPSSRTIKRI